MSQWTRHDASEHHPLWWGTLCTIAIGATIVATFMVSYFYLWIVNSTEGQSGWFKTDAELPPITFPTIALILVILSVLGSHLCAFNRKKRCNIRITVYLGLIPLSAILIFSLHIFQFYSFPFAPRDHIFASFCWVLTGFHLVLVGIVIFASAVIATYAFRKGHEGLWPLSATSLSMYWYFVAGSWFPIYFVLYLAPRLRQL